jgi:predicted phosphoribosyltransferase
MFFANRLDAGRRLADALAHHRGERPLIVAIPRGAVPMAAEIAARLDGDLDVVLARKLGAPWQPELAVGAVDESGWTYVADFARQAGADAAYLEREKAAQMEKIRERRANYTPGRSSLDPAGRVVIVIDDGLATGATMIAALHALRGRSPSRLVCAVPVASQEALAKVREYADEVVCLDAPAMFGAVGAFYRDFRQVDDREVVAVLAAADAARAKREQAQDAG